MTRKLTRRAALFTPAAAALMGAMAGSGRAATPASAAGAPPGGIAVVLNSGAASISVIDMERMVELRREPVLREPHHWALTPDHKTLLVGDTVGNTLFELDPLTAGIRGRITCPDPYQLGFSPDAKWLTVNGLARNQVDIYEAATMKLARRLPARSMPSHLAYSPDSSMVYVTLQGTDRLMAIDLRNFNVLWDKPIGKAPAGVIWLNGQLLVGIMGSDYIAVADPVDGSVKRRVKTGRGAHNLFISPDGSFMLIGNRVEGTVSMLDTRTVEVTRTYSMPGGADDMEFAPDGRVWLTRRFVQEVAVLDLKSGKYESIVVGRSPHGIFLSTDLRRLAPAKVG